MKPSCRALSPDRSSLPPRHHSSSSNSSTPPRWDREQPLLGLVDLRQRLSQLKEPLLWQEGRQGGQQLRTWSWWSAASEEWLVSQWWSGPASLGTLFAGRDGQSAPADEGRWDAVWSLERSLSGSAAACCCSEPLRDQPS